MFSTLIIELFTSPYVLSVFSFMYLGTLVGYFLDLLCIIELLSPLS
jgi:hypothetical protein